MKKMLSKIQLFLAEDMLVALGGGGYVGGLGVLRSKGLDAVTRTFENLPGAQIQAGRWSTTSNSDSDVMATGCFRIRPRLIRLTFDPLQQRLPATRHSIGTTVVYAALNLSCSLKKHPRCVRVCETDHKCNQKLQMLQKIQTGGLVSTSMLHTWSVLLLNSAKPLTQLNSTTLLSRKSPVKCPDWPRAIPSVAMRIWRCRSMHAQRWRIASCCETPATCGETNRSCGDTWTRVLQGCNPLCGLWNTECWFTQPLKVLLAQLELSECSGSHLAESFGWNRGDLITELCYGIGLFANLEKTTPRCAMSEVLDTWATITSLALQGQVITQVTQTHLSTYAVLGLWASDTILA